MVVTRSSFPRLKREECARTNHDSVFSNWEILIGPSDWEEYSLGKEGVERYRIHNLPIRCSCPGLYELGVAILPRNEGRNPRKPHSDEIIVVYLGEAENIRTRLQHYGRAGSHLDNGKSIKGEKTSLQKCRGLFTEIFSRGCAVLFRWVPMGNKKEAEQAEARLLGVFDYAWNTRANGLCRREDILSRLDIRVSRQILKKIQQWKAPGIGRKVGIKLKANSPIEQISPPTSLKGFLIAQIRKLLSSQPRQVEVEICGVAMGDGSICKDIPLFGRKRCEIHKGNKINGFNSENQSECGAGLADGSICMETPVPGRKRCKLHKGRKAAQNTRAKNKLQNNDSSCNEVEGRKRIMSKQARNTVDLGIKGNYGVYDKSFEEHTIASRQYASGDDLSSSRVCKLPECGVNLGDGNFCMNSPVPGRKRCQQHKGRKVIRTAY